MTEEISQDYHLLTAWIKQLWVKQLIIRGETTQNESICYKNFLKVLEPLDEDTLILVVNSLDPLVYHPSVDKNLAYTEVLRKILPRLSPEGIQSISVNTLVNCFYLINTLTDYIQLSLVLYCEEMITLAISQLPEFSQEICSILISNLFSYRVKSCELALSSLTQLSKQFNMSTLSLFYP